VRNGRGAAVVDGTADFSDTAFDDAHAERLNDTTTAPRIARLNR
jgi:hypothetical protein